MISVERRKLITSEFSFCFQLAMHRGYCEQLTLTNAPMTPNDVKRRYSKGLVLDVVFKNG